MLAAVLLLLAADAPTPGGCITAHTQAQLERNAARLLAARELLFTCADAKCPRPIREECGRWLDEVRRAIPTVVVAARGPSGDVAAALSIDGEPRAPALDGKPLELEPGQHTFTCRADSGEAVTITALVVAGEKERRLICELGAVPAAQPPPPAAVEAPPPPQPSRWPAWTLGAVAVAAAGVAAGFYVSGWQEDGRLRAECAPQCSDERVAGLRARWAGGDISAALAVVALAAAVLWWVVQSR